MAADVASGMSKAAAARKYGVSTRTVFRVLADDYQRSDRVLKPCGTNAAYQRHRSRGERCLPCSDAHAAAQKEWSNGKERT